MKLKSTRSTIEQLKELGYRTYVRHERPICVTVGSTQRMDDTELADIGFGTRHELEQIRGTTHGARFGLKGGSTTVTIVNRETGAEVARGVSHCRTDDELGPGDPFNRKLGTRIALGRALVGYRDLAELAS